VTLIYHIAAAADWAQARRDGQYTMSTRGRTLAEEGFIHASTAEQVPLVADAFYRDAPDLVLLVIDTERVGSPIRYEQVPGQPDPYPHIYGPLNLDAVVETRPFQAPIS
jgi:glutathione S-transferase